MAVSERVTTLRTKKGLSKRALAERAEVHEKTITRLEVHGTEPKLRILRSIAAALDVEVAELVG